MAHRTLKNGLKKTQGFPEKVWKNAHVWAVGVVTLLADMVASRVHTRVVLRTLKNN
jgi:hypothetical protein